MPLFKSERKVTTVLFQIFIYKYNFDIFSPRTYPNAAFVLMMMLTSLTEKLRGAEVNTSLYTRPKFCRIGIVNS